MTLPSLARARRAVPPLVGKALALALLTAMPAEAYIGPGAGMGVFGAIVALFGALFLLVVGFVWYPIKRLIGALRRRESPASGRGQDRS
jgi:hypothetical protein